MVFGIAQGVALLWAFAMGFILDRVPRLAGVCIAFGLAAIGYSALGLVDDPLGRGMIWAAVLAGIGEASAVVSAGVWIGQEAPATNRGAVFGTYGLCGSLGMICLTYAGGQVFDGIGPNAPFLMMGAVNGVVLVAALATWRSAPVALAVAVPGPDRRG
jgi:MFS family permease